MLTSFSSEKAVFSFLSTKHSKHAI